jgi:hypothetical protein
LKNLKKLQLQHGLDYRDLAIAFIQCPELIELKHVALERPMNENDKVLALSYADKVFRNFDALRRRSSKARKLN